MNKNNIYLENIFSCYFAHSSDEKIRYSASSGGFCKSFLWYLVENKIVDYAIITRTGSSASPLKPETLITNKKKDIISTKTNSVYAPTNPLLVLKKIKKNKKYAFVGLPCHCKALRNMQDKGLFKNIKIIIGLFCNHAPDYGFTEEAISKLNVKSEDISHIGYRGNGWPGKFSLTTKKGKLKQLDYIKEVWTNNEKHMRECCRNCSILPFYSDISVCDPWELGFEEKNDVGTTLTICNNEFADNLVNDAKEKGYLILKECSFDDFLRSQGKHIEKKLRNRLE